MTHQDPRDPLLTPRDTVRNEPYRPIDPLDPAIEPGIDPREPAGQNWGLIGGLAAVLIVAVVLASMWGSPTTDQVRSPAPVTTPQGSDPTTTGSVPGRQMAPAERPAVPAPATPSR